MSCLRLVWFLVGGLFVSTLYAVYAPIPELEQAETVSIYLDAGVRQDDNIFGSAANEQDSLIIFSAAEVRVDTTLSDQGILRGSYRGEVNYFDDRPTEDTLINHRFRVGLDYQFSDTLTFAVTDVITVQENPEAILPLTDQRLSSDQSSWDHTLSARLLWLARERWGFAVKGFTYGLNYDVAALARLLDRVETLAGVELRHNLSETTVVLGEAQFQDITYDSGDLLKGSETVNLLLGMERSLSEKGFLDLRLGVESRDRNTGEGSDNFYGSLGLLYRYLPESFFSIGVSHFTRESSEVTAFFDQQTLALILTAQHDLTGNGKLFLTGTLSHDWVDLEPRANVDPADETILRAGAKLIYRVTERLSAVASADWDNVSSDLAGREQDRLRFGLSVRYQFGLQ